MATDYAKINKYFKRLADPFQIPEKMMDVYTDGIYHMAEYPEYEGSETFDFALVHNRDFDAEFWKTIRKTVLDRKEQIDVWLNSRASHLLQDPETGAVVGAVVSRNHKDYYIYAKNGVVLATGGFENNPVMQQNYLHITKLTPFGSLYNGSIFAIADDGSRFMKEDAKFRHGHIYEHGDYLMPHAYDNAWLVFDQKQYNRFVAEKKQTGQLRYPKFLDKTISAVSSQELAEKMGVPADKLAETIKTFNTFAESGRDAEFGREAAGMEVFASGQLYAIKLAPAVLNTQGGPERNEKGEILDANDQVIPHLYGAGELGGICANCYQGGNLAECLIFGKISGTNAASVKDDAQAISPTKPVPAVNDLVDGERMDNIELGENQYLGSTEAGIGGKIVVRVTYKDEKIEDVEVLESHEIEGIGAVAIKELAAKIVAANSTEIDAVSDASTTTRALEEAVNKAIEQAK